MIAAYFKFEVLPLDIKQKYKISSKTRLDCTAYTNNLDYNPLAQFINAKNHLSLYLSPASEVVKKNSKRQADRCLNNGKQLSSLYFEDIENKQYAYGDYGSDCLLFIVNADYTTIEILVCPNVKNLQRVYYQKLIDSDFDTTIENLKANAKPFFNY